MSYIDILIAPFYFLLVFVIAYFYKSVYKKDTLIRLYFLKAYLLRIMGGLAFGSVYFFYYGGGDTFNYFSDSCVISGAMRDNFLIGSKLMFFKTNVFDGEIYNYIRRLNFAMDPSSMIISRMASFINLFTFDSYVSTTIVFSLIGFWGSWRLFLTLCHMFPTIHKELSIGCLYLPSIIFWTSGIMKDTICSTALCLMFCGIINIVYFKKYTIGNFLTVIICGYLLVLIKIYIIMCFASTISIYILSLYNSKIKNQLFRSFLKPVYFVFAILLGYFATLLISSENKEYNLDDISATAISTASYIGQVSLEVGGSYYSLGSMDLTITNTPVLIVKAFIVTFYRPLLWEIYNPLMLLSSLEGMYFLYLSYIFIRFWIKSERGTKIFTPFTIFCFLFSIVFAFGVGVVSNNFGTLARYKAPMLPFFVCGVYATIHGLKKMGGRTL